jgi:hypothetical protein
MPTSRSPILANNPAAGRFPSSILAERAARTLQNSGWEVMLAKTHIQSPIEISVASRALRVLAPRTTPLKMVSQTIEASPKG